MESERPRRVLALVLNPPEPPGPRTVRAPFREGLGHDPLAASRDRLVEEALGLLLSRHDPLNREPHPFGGVQRLLEQRAPLGERLPVDGRPGEEEDVEREQTHRHLAADPVEVVLATAPPRYLLERLDLVGVRVDGHALALEDRRDRPDGPGSSSTSSGNWALISSSRREKRRTGPFFGMWAWTRSPSVLVLERRPSVHPFEHGREVRFPLREHRSHGSTDLEGNGRKALHAFLDEDVGDQLEVAREVERRLDLLTNRLRPVAERLRQGVQDRHLANADSQGTEDEPHEELTLGRRGSNEELRQDIDLDVLRTRALRLGDSGQLGVDLRHLERRRLLEPPDAGEELAGGRAEVPGLLRPPGDGGLLGMRRGRDRAPRERVGHPELDPLVLRPKEPLG